MAITSRKHILRCTLALTSLLMLFAASGAGAAPAGPGTQLTPSAPTGTGQIHVYLEHCDPTYDFPTPVTFQSLQDNCEPTVSDTSVGTWDGTGTGMDQIKPFVNNFARFIVPSGEFGFNIVGYIPHVGIGTVCSSSHHSRPVLHQPQGAITGTIANGEIITCTLYLSHIS